MHSRSLLRHPATPPLRYSSRMLRQRAALAAAASPHELLHGAGYELTTTSDVPVFQVPTAPRPRRAATSTAAASQLRCCGRCIVASTAASTPTAASLQLRQPQLQQRRLRRPVHRSSGGVSSDGVDCIATPTTAAPTASTALQLRRPQLRRRRLHCNSDDRSSDGVDCIATPTTAAPTASTALQLRRPQLQRRRLRWPVHHSSGGVDSNGHCIATTTPQLRRHRLRRPLHCNSDDCSSSGVDSGDRCIVASVASTPTAAAWQC